uniref:Rhomboid protease n=1 Tax=Panagrellus redivivus TaxID=6233 RepID=A0A7E4W4U4_PANRE
MQDPAENCVQFQSDEAHQNQNNQPNQNQNIEPIENQNVPAAPAKSNKSKKKHKKAKDNPPKPRKRPSAREIKHCENSAECETWWDFFKSIDKDHDGYIPIQEMKYAVSKNRHFFGISAEQVEKLAVKCDKNHDKMIEFPEFCEMMCLVKKQRFRRATIKYTNAVLPKDRQAKNTSYMVAYTCWPPPIFITAITILEITFYFYYAVGTVEGLSSNGPAPIDNELALSPKSKWQVWRYLTYVLLHNGYLHVIMNLIMQLLLGLSLELVHNGLRIAAIYFAGAFTGALLFFVFDPKTYLVGASAGVYALISAHLADVFLNWSEMRFRWIRVVFFGVWVIADFGWNIYSRYFARNPTKIAVMGHVGGAIAGVLLGVVILRNLQLKIWERIAWWICLVIYVLFIVACVICVACGFSIEVPTKNVTATD